MTEKPYRACAPGSGAVDAPREERDRKSAEAVAPGPKGLDAPGSRREFIACSLAVLRLLSPTHARERRTWCYVQRPRDYEIAGCDCGNTDPDWSEFVGYLWCPICQKDYIPRHGGIFDGPIPVNACRLMGIDLSMYNIETAAGQGVDGKGGHRCPAWKGR